MTNPHPPALKPELTAADFRIALKQLDFPDDELWGMCCEFYIAHNKEIVQEALRRAANADYVLVPREPTEAMLMAGIPHTYGGQGDISARIEAREIYKAMINAAAQPITKDDCQ